MSKYDCPYFDENRAVCDDGECGCCECQMVRDEAAKEAHEHTISSVLDEILDRIASLGYEADSADEPWRSGVLYGLGEIENFIGYIKERENEAK